MICKQCHKQYESYYLFDVKQFVKGKLKSQKVCVYCFNKKALEKLEKKKEGKNANNPKQSKRV